MTDLKSYWASLYLHALRERDHSMTCNSRMQARMFRVELIPHHLYDYESALLATCHASLKQLQHQGRLHSCQKTPFATNKIQYPYLRFIVYGHSPCASFTWLGSARLGWIRLTPAKPAVCANRPFKSNLGSFATDCTFHPYS